jgi:hypothetical protein
MSNTTTTTTTSPTVTITADLLQLLLNVAYDAQHNMACNCGGPCDGTCTHGLAIQAQALAQFELRPQTIERLAQQIIDRNAQANAAGAVVDMEADSNDACKLARLILNR